MSDTKTYRRPGASTGVSQYGLPRSPRSGMAVVNDSLNVCPVSNARGSPTSSGCPFAHAGENRSIPPAALTPSPQSNPETTLTDHKDDVTCPVLLPDVSGDLNPSYSEFDDEALYTNLRERVRYLLRFINFTEKDVEALNDFQPILLPMVPQLVDNIYHHLFKFDVTKNMFMPRKEGQEGRMLVDLHDLHLDATQITMRKKTFAVYLRKLVTSDYDDFATWQYFDHVGLMHTGKNELKHRKLMGKAPLYIDLMHLAMLLAWTLDVLTPVILSYVDYPLTRRIEIMRAFQKVVWIQNDLFSRHYAVRSTEVAGLNQIRRQHDLGNNEDVTALTEGASFHATSSINSSSSGGSTHGNTDSSPYVKDSKQDKKYGGWLFRNS